MDSSLEQIIKQDLSLLRSHREIGRCFGEFIDAGSYGFVVEYLDNSPEKKVIKILDPKYVEYVFRATQPQTHTSLLAQRASHANTEWDLAQKVGYTKSPHLMPLMSGPPRIDIGGRSISFLVMPRLQTIEDLEPALDKERQIVSILSDCCSGLQVLHRQPEFVRGRKNGMDALVHCDIKPNNIFYAGNPPCFMIGDYSISQWITDLEKNPVSFSSSENPYCAQGYLARTSDIYSLGWVLFYWMNGKVHPTKNDIIARKNGTLSMPSSWGDNPELWNVFLKMTAPKSSERLQRAEDVKVALQKALLDHEQRLASANALQQYDAGERKGQLEGAGLIVLISAAYSLLRLFFGSEPIPSDGSGRLHGTIKKEIPYLGGSFKGQWEHGHPKDGTYTSPTGIKRTGQWSIQDHFTEPFMMTGVQDFTGLSYIKNGQENSYQGHSRIHWPWGTCFECDLDADRIVNGVMTFSDGTQLKQNFVCKEALDPFAGILCSEENGNYTGCVRFSVGPEVYVECELVDNTPGPGCVFLPGEITICHSNPSYEPLLNLLVNMFCTGSYFQGIWDRDGFPQEGTYAFSNNTAVKGRFSFVVNKKYPNAIYTGMIGDDHLPWGVGTAQYLNGEVFTGEFYEGSPLQ